MLGQIFRFGQPSYAAVIVIDSLSDGKLEADIRQAGYPVIYENAGVNLGAAANLDRRLQLAAEQDADWCFAVNHDGTYDPALIARLVQKAYALPKVGALFPKRVLIDRGGTSFRPISSVFEMASHAAAGEPQREDVEVAWDSSNGALYGLEPVRRGVRVWTDLWHGWEDLAYSWELSRNGWKQYRASDAEYLDDYEYQKLSLLGRQVYIARKPPWYAYYLIRNLVLFVRRSRGGMRGWLFVGKRLAREIPFTLLFRSQKLLRLRMLFRGLMHGLAGVVGKSSVP